VYVSVIFYLCAKCCDSLPFPYLSFFSLCHMRIFLLVQYFAAGTLTLPHHKLHFFYSNQLRDVPQSLLNQNDQADRFLNLRWPGSFSDRNKASDPHYAWPLPLPPLIHGFISHTGKCTDYLVEEVYRDLPRKWRSSTWNRLHKARLFLNIWNIIWKFFRSPGNEITRCVCSCRRKCICIRPIGYWSSACKWHPKWECKPAHRP
jgi:hypothetical protein